MDKHLQHQITDILAQIDQDTDVPTLHVILMDTPEEEDQSDEQVIESTVETPDQEIPEVRPFTVVSPPPSNHPHVAWLVAGLATLPTLVLISLLFLPALLPVVTVTLIPVTRMITTTTEVTVTAGQITGKDQIAGRLLSSLTMTDAKTVPATGVQHQLARTAAGVLTFYNAALIQQVIPAGTLLTASSGIQIVTDEQAVIPPGSLSTNGQVTIAAHAVESGPGGNIRAGDLYGPCCRVNVFVTNQAFTGGQAAITYKVVSKQDVEQTEQVLTTNLKDSVQAAFTAQLKDGETMITPLCQGTTSISQKVGEQAESVTVEVKQTCIALVYSPSGLEQVMSQALSRQAQATLGTGYTPTGAIQVEVREVKDQQEEHATLRVTATQSYAYQFTSDQQEQMKRLIAGKSQQEATALLLSMPGVADVLIEPGGTLPTRVKQIEIRDH